MIGIDLVNIKEFSRSLEVGGETFLNKTFSPEELSGKRSEHLAGVFAAKEAVKKALNLPHEDWRNIKIFGDEKPYALCGNTEIEISISHHGDYAVAVAMKRI